jgi:hypothetical protein
VQSLEFTGDVAEQIGAVATAIELTVPGVIDAVLPCLLRVTADDDGSAAPAEGACTGSDCSFSTAVSVIRRITLITRSAVD